jgi:hypothetical protein
VIGALFLCLAAAVGVLAAVALPQLRDDPEVVSRGEQYARKARAAAAPVLVLARRARIVAEVAASKVADSAASLSGRAARVRR